VLLTGKTIWITGASRGIGRATALACAQHGATLLLSARTEKSLELTAQEIHAATGQIAHLVPFDVCDAASIKSAFQQVHREFKQLDGLVNNAGILRDALIGMITETQLAEVMRTNLYAPIHLMQYCARLMTPKKAGSIVNVASIIGRTGNEGQTAYSASKAGLIGATKSAARELARHNVRVNAVAPGVIQTDMIANIPAKKMDELQACIKMPRLGEARDVAHAIVFLLSDLSAYVTGQVLGVDGGMWL
jgi:3-oxoacyl-[acyl-carrier protein] reductase